MSSLEPLQQLLRQSHQARPEDLPDMIMQAAPLLDADTLVIFVVDHSQRLLVPLLGGSAPRRETITIDGTLAGRAFSMVTPAGTDQAGRTHLWMPLLDGTERLGVLEIVAAGPLSDQAVDDCAAVASLLAEMVVTRDLYSDTIERLRRREPMQLAAEMLRAQLPPLTFSTGHVMISGILEPSYDVAGDAFDYAVNGDLAHLALFDAAGHGSAGGMRSVILASIALAGYRNARRAGGDLTATYHHIDRAVRAYDRAGMITAILAELDQRTGILQVISAGHPSGMITRGGKVVKVIPTPTALPLGLGDRRPPVVVQENLERGDRLLLYTDGIIDARSTDGEQFGIDRLVEFAARALADGLPLPETTRRLVHAILEHQQDKLQDDATVLLVEWCGPPNDPTAPDGWQPISPSDTPATS
jgi:serine phosphatase RsbU (regulator of sigma subunit)